MLPGMPSGTSRQPDAPCRSARVVGKYRKSSLARVRSLTGAKTIALSSLWEGCSSPTNGDRPELELGPVNAMTTPVER